MNWNDWLNLLLRWAHLVAGIAWIGSSFYFIWLDSHLEAPTPGSADENVEGGLWMVHSGGFYKVERRKIEAGSMPAILHWFKWEAALTWITGVLLLTVVYYMSGGIYLVDRSVADMSPLKATVLAVGLLVGSWWVYDELWKRAAGRFEAAATVISYLLVAGATWLFCDFLSGRAAFVHVGAMLGTVMVANVWVRILPAQQAMIDATKEGRPVNWDLGAQAKRRSVHNSYMTLPVLFIMLSNHFPATFGHRWNWLVLVLLMFVGGAARHLMIGKSPRRFGWAFPMTAALAALVAFTLVPGTVIPASAGGEPVPFYQVQAIVTSRCVLCHSAQPRYPLYGAAPSGVLLETEPDIRKYARRLYVRACATRSMPLGNMTAMTEEERRLLARWVEQGMP